MNRYILSYILIIILFPFSLYSQPEKLGKVKDAVLSEISGIIPSSFQKGNFWVHNDSGDKAQVYLIGSNARLKATVRLEGVNVVDCEDIAKTVIDNKPYLILADIGNNLRNREVLSLYLFPEPNLNDSIKSISIPNEKIQKIDFKYSDKKRDAEAIFVDQQKQEIFIVSKRDFHSTVFSFPLSATSSEKLITLSPQLKLPFTFVTSADMSSDGKFILIKNLTSVFLWERNLNDSVIQTLATSFKEIPYEVEPQGEAICFDAEGNFFYTISEKALGLESYLNKYNYSTL